MKLVNKACSSNLWIPFSLIIQQRRPPCLDNINHQQLTSTWSNSFSSLPITMEEICLLSKLSLFTHAQESISLTSWKPYAGICVSICPCNCTELTSEYSLSLVILLGLLAVSIPAVHLETQRWHVLSSFSPLSPSYPSACFTAWW